MKKGQVLEGLVQRLDFPNKGFVQCEEGCCTVKNVLPGQRVSFAVQKVRKGKAEGRLLEILSPSPKETESACPHFGSCGGCSYQTLPYEEQLHLKEEQVRRLLAPVLSKQEKGIDEIFEGIIPSPVQFGYRNKMEFSFGDEVKDGPLSLGLHKRGSFYDIVTVQECQIVDEDYRKILRCVLDYFTERQTSFYHRLRHTGYLRHLLVRKAKRTGEILIALVTTTQEEMDLTPLVERLLALQAGASEEGINQRMLEQETKVQEETERENTGEQRTEEEKAETEKLGQKQTSQNGLEGRIVGILHTKNDAVADAVKNDETVTLYGQDFFYEEILGLKFNISEFSFFQTNSLGAEVLYEKVREYIGDVGCGADGRPDKVIFDLYSGTGTIAQMMAPVAKQVIGVEIVEEAVGAAKENAALNGLKNCTFIAGDVLKVIDSIKEKPDLIILDPPRDGIHPKALDKIIRYGVERIVYISCKPTSLARDLEVFLARGYVAERGTCVDMFPGSGHVETVVSLSLKSGGPKIEISMQPGEHSLYEPKEKGTYGKIKAYILEKYGLNVSDLYIAQIKDKCGLDKRLNYNLSKKEDARVPECPEEKEDAIMDAFRHFGLI